MSFTPTSTDAALLSVPHVCQLLNLQEKALLKLSELLKLPLQPHPLSGEASFQASQVEVLRKAVSLYKEGQNLQSIVQLLSEQETASGAALQSIRPASMAASVPPSPQASGFQGASSDSSNAHLGAIVEAISSSKEGILNEISRLLDDRLAGLDEVVIELIRTKSENDSLRQRMATLLKEKEALQHDLDAFKPVQFGFYKKVR